MDFYLGAHHPNWLATAGVPLFVSRRAFNHAPKIHRAIAPWALDSGGFTELQMHRGWLTTPREYASEARRWMDAIGLMQWAAPQDWMCEERMLKLTGLSVAEHQQRTVTNYLELRTIAPDVPWIPVLQGWGASDYMRHVEDYERAGITLRTQPLVGIGSVCRRQSTGMACELVQKLTRGGIRLHGFGFKIRGLAKAPLASADSLAWSYNARRHPPISGHRHKSCANCLEWALRWRTKALAAANGPLQMDLFA